MKSKSLRYVASAFLTVSMCFSVLAGCGKKSANEDSGLSSDVESTVQEETADETSTRNTGSGDSEFDMDELYVIDMLGCSIEDFVSTDSTVGKEIAKNTGIALNYIAYPGDFQEKQAMMLAGGDYGEIQYMQHNDMVKKYIDAGALINLDDYKDMLPNFYKRFEEQIPYWRALAPDGGLYKWEVTVPRGNTGTFLFGVEVRSDILEYYGWPELVTASDWIDFLEKAVKDFPTTPDGQDTIGITLLMGEPWGAQGVIPIAAEYGDTYVNAGNDYYIYNVKTKQFEDYLMCDETKESMRFFNTLYQKGILDPECFTDLADITEQKMSSGRAIAEFYCNWFNVGVYNELANAGHPEMAYIMLPFQLDSQEGQKYIAKKTVTYAFDSYGVTKNCKDPERLLKAIDWICSEEGQMLLQCGLEGVHYTVEDGKRVPTELRIQCTKDNAVVKQEGLQDGISAYFYGLPYIFAPAEDGQPYKLSVEQEYNDEFMLSDREKEAFAALGWRNSGAWWEDNVEFADCGFIDSCALDTTSDLGKVGQKMVDVRIKYTGALIMAEDFDTTWEEMMEEYNKLDRQAVIDAMNEKLKELNATLK